MQSKFLVLEWKDLYELCLRLYWKINKDHYQPDLIVGVARGGWIPTRVLSDLLENPNIANIKVEFYYDIGKTGRTPKVTQPISSRVKGLKVLVVDDVSDTGLTLSEVKKNLVKKKPLAIKIATLHYKTHSILKPDYYVKKTSAWIVYPHERYEFIKSMINTTKNTDIYSIKKWFKQINLKQPYIEKMIEKAWAEIKEKRVHTSKISQ